MKKVLLTLLTLFVAGGAWAQVEETDLSAYTDVMYAQSIEALPGTTSVRLPINVKSHADFTATESMLVLPEGVTVLKDDGVNPGRYDASQDVKLVSFMGNKQDAGYKIVSVIASQGTGDYAETTYGFTAGDDALGYILIDVSSLAVGEYALIMKDATISGFFDGSKDAIISDEIVTKLVITNRLTLSETSTEVPAVMSGVNIRVERTINANEWSTLCLPFDMFSDQVEEVFGADAKFALFTGYTKDGELPSTSSASTAQSIVLNFAAQDWSADGDDGIFANTPYLVWTSKKVEMFELDGVNINPTDAKTEVKRNGTTGRVVGTFYGTQSAGKSIPQNGLFLSGGNFWYSKGLTKIKAFRGYFVLNDVLADLSSANVKVNVDGETTGINGISYKQISEGVYDLSGRKIQLENNDLNKLQKGVYIIDGKKVTIK